MTPSKKPLLVAVIAAVLAWLFGTFFVGTADEHWYTASGTVNMLDPIAIDRALRDPTFTASLAWGQFSLVGKYWAFTLPIGLAVTTFVLVLSVSHFLGRRARPNDPASPQ